MILSARKEMTIEYDCDDKDLNKFHSDDVTLFAMPTSVQQAIHNDLFNDLLNTVSLNEKL